MSLSYESSPDRDRLDVALIHEFLASSYWAAGRSRDRGTFVRALAVLSRI